MLFMFYTVRAITPQFFFHSAHKVYATHVPMAPPGREGTFARTVS